MISNKTCLGVLQRAHIFAAAATWAGCGPSGPDETASGSWLVGTWFADPCDINELGSCGRQLYFTFVFEEDGRLVETRHACGRETDVWEATWTTDEQGVASIEGDDNFTFTSLGTDEPVYLEATSSCHLLNFEIRNAETSSGQLQRGPVCWSSDGECGAGQMMWCDEGPPTCGDP